MNYLILENIGTYLREYRIGKLSARLAVNAISVIKC